MWINDGGQLKLAQSVLDEIPPFVHRTGNTLASLSDRLDPRVFIMKPIMHFTADRPLAANVEVLISHGRPWFAYPRPDDFSVVAAPGDGGISGFDKAQVPELQPTAEGYPWLAPPHCWCGFISVSVGGNGNEITELGLHWQSLIVSPNRQSWMTPPPIEDRNRYGWWERLRTVPSSWLGSQGESDRFLYYDGPTHMLSPVQVGVKGKRLHLKSLPMPLSEVALEWEIEQNGCPPDTEASGSHGAKRQGLYIEVAGGHTTARVVPVADAESDVDLEMLAPMAPAAAEQHFLAMLTESGLTAEEAAGLADVWKSAVLGNAGQAAVGRPFCEGLRWNVPAPRSPQAYRSRTRRGAAHGAGPMTRMDLFHSPPPHFFDRFLHVAGMQFHPATGIFQQMSLESQIDGVQGGPLDAVIGRQTADVDFLHASLAEKIAEARRGAMPVVKKAAVAVDLPIRAFAENPRHAVEIQAGMELRAERTLNTMNGPKDLRQPVQLDHLARRPAGMVGGKAAVVRWVPVLRGHD